MSFLVMVVFLELNGWTFEAEEIEVVRAMVALAAGSLTESSLAEWLQRHSTKPGER